MAPWPYAGPRLACWPRRKTSASSPATNCSGCSNPIWTNAGTDNWSRRRTSDRVFPSGAGCHLQLRAGHHRFRAVEEIARLGNLEPSSKKDLLLIGREGLRARKQIFYLPQMVDALSTLGPESLS